MPESAQSIMVIEREIDGNAQFFVSDKVANYLPLSDNLEAFCSEAEEHDNFKEAYASAKNLLNGSTSGGIIVQHMK